MEPYHTLRPDVERLIMRIGPAICATLGALAIVEGHT